MNLVLNEAKFTFFQYPFKIDANQSFKGFIRMPNLLDLAVMKAYAIGRRSKGKDYIDLYFILSRYHSISEISKRAEDIFGPLFSEKQFRAQLCYFEDIDFDEKTEFVINAPSENQIKKELTKYAIEF